MKNKFNKKEVFSIIWYILMIFFVTSGVTFSYFAVVDSAEKDSTKIYSGKIDINFIEGNEVSTDVLYPIKEPSFNSLRNVYRNRFGISSSGTLEQLVAIDFKVTENQFVDNSLKYAIYSGDGNKLQTGYLNQGTVKLIDNLYFKENEKREFVLIVWLDDNGNDQNAMQDKKMSGTIVVNSTQYKY